MNKDEKLPDEGKKQGNWNIGGEPGVERKKERTEPEKMDKDESNLKAKEEMDEEGYIHDSGYVKTPPEGNDPAKNADMKAPNDEP